MFGVKPSISVIFINKNTQYQWYNNQNVKFYKYPYFRGMVDTMSSVGFNNLDLKGKTCGKLFYSVHFQLNSIRHPKVQKCQFRHKNGLFWSKNLLNVLETCLPNSLIPYQIEFLHNFLIGYEAKFQFQYFCQSNLIQDCRLSSAEKRTK